MQSICIIIPYFTNGGGLPPLFEAWKISAKKNETIDFLILSDVKKLKTEGNIRVIYTSLSEIKERFDKKLGFDVNLSSAYKLCDFRPAYAYCFEEYVKGYDFWGYCDIDLVVGDMRSYFTEERLNQYDKFFYNGHISIYRNCEKMNTLFMFDDGEYPALNYKDVYKSSESYYFDEQRGMLSRCIKNNIKVWPQGVMQNIMRDPITDRRKFVWGGEQYIAIWENGHLFSVNEKMKKTEILYAHFFRRKFSTELVPLYVNKIKIIPGKIIYNDDIKVEDFFAEEHKGYKATYYYETLKKSIIRYGIKGTFKRQKWSKDSDVWLKKLLEGEK